jgi:hypothetical protein
MRVDQMTILPRWRSLAGGRCFKSVNISLRALTEVDHDHRRRHGHLTRQDATANHQVLRRGRVPADPTGRRAPFTFGAAGTTTTGRAAPEADRHDPRKLLPTVTLELRRRSSPRAS